MTEDGRTFFSTTDGLVPQDTNKFTDVYEYVDGRPRLISPGTGSAIEPPFGTDPTVQILSAGWPAPGLIGVSADGTDVYFATFDVLVPQDRNGGSLKIYDARTAGGFPVAQTSPGCAAADECHGPSSLAPAPAVGGSAANLGAGGNATAKPSVKKHRKPTKSQKHKKQKKKKKKKHVKRHAGRKQG
jgi:hypothetical protein